MQLQECNVFAFFHKLASLVFEHKKLSLPFLQSVAFLVGFPHPKDDTLSPHGSGL